MESLLKQFTFMSLDEIEALVKSHWERPEERVAQKTLAYEICSMIYPKRDSKMQVQ